MKLTRRRGFGDARARKTEANGRRRKEENGRLGTSEKGGKTLKKKYREKKERKQERTQQKKKTLGSAKGHKGKVCWRPRTGRRSSSFACRQPFPATIATLASSAATHRASMPARAPGRTLQPSPQARKCYNKVSPNNNNVKSVAGRTATVPARWDAGARARACDGMHGLAARTAAAMAGPVHLAEESRYARSTKNVKARPGLLRPNKDQKKPCVFLIFDTSFYIQI